MFNVKIWNILVIMIHIKYFLRRAGKGRGTKIKCDKKGRGNHKKVMSPGVPGGGWGQNNLTHTLVQQTRLS